MTNGSYLTRDQILAAQDLPAEDVPVPEWGGTVRIRGMTLGERDAWRADYNAGDKSDGRFLAPLIIDQAGQPLFTAEEICSMPAANESVIGNLVKIALRLSGLQAGAVAEAEKNSAPSPSASSPAN